MRCLSTAQGGDGLPGDSEPPGGSVLVRAEVEALRPPWWGAGLHILAAREACPHPQASPVPQEREEACEPAGKRGPECHIGPSPRPPTGSRTPKSGG